MNTSPDNNTPEYDSGPIYERYAGVHLNPDFVSLLNNPPCENTTPDDLAHLNPIATRRIDGIHLGTRTLTFTLPYIERGVPVLQKWARDPYESGTGITLHSNWGWRGQVGSATFIPHGDGMWELPGITVAYPYSSMSYYDEEDTVRTDRESERLRGKSIGSHLLDVVEDVAVACGSKEISLKIMTRTGWSSKDLWGFLGGIPASSSNYADTTGISTREFLFPHADPTLTSRFESFVQQQLQKRILRIGSQEQRQLAREDLMRLRFYFQNGFRISRLVISIKPDGNLSYHDIFCSKELPHMVRR